MRLPLFPRRGRKPVDVSGQAGPAGASSQELFQPVAQMTHEIQEAGWTTVAVVREEVAPPWAYTVGLWISHRGADLAMFGVPPDLARTIFDELGQRMAEGWMPAPGETIDDMGSRPLKLCRIHASWRETQLFAFSDICHGLIRPPMLQVVWPDAEGRFPGQATGPVRERACDIQPMLWLPADDNPPGPWTRFSGVAA